MSQTTIVVVPRERLQSIIWSLESLFTTIADNVPVIVVDGGISRRLRRKLDAVRARRPFRHVSLPHKVTPHQARNVGADAADTEFIVFADNDLIYEPGWLEALEANAVRTGAGAVAPLTCNGPPAATTIHHAGGLFVIHGDVERPVMDSHHRLRDHPIGGWNAVQAPEEHEVAEFHCLLVRRSTLDRIGPLDERLITREPEDFAMRLKLADEKMTMEHSSVVTYMRTERMDIRDLPHFLFRWSEPLARNAVETFEATWGVRLERELILRNWIGWHRKRAVRACFPRLCKLIGRKRFDRTVVRLCEFVVNAAHAGQLRNRGEPRVPADPDRAGTLAVYRSLHGRSMPRTRVPLPGCVGAAKPGANQVYDQIIGGMATMPSRYNTAPEAIRSVVDQVDRLYLFLDGFEEIPEFAKHPRIVTTRSQDVGDLKAMGKFFILKDLARPALFFGFDDDMLYPPDYVATLRESLEAYGYGAVVGVHGSVFVEPMSSYLTDRNGPHRSAAQDDDCLVDILGTDTVAFATDRMSFDVSTWRNLNMLDLSLACEAAQRGMPMVSLRREAGWIKGLASNQPDSIYRRLTEDDTVQTGLARALIAYKQGRVALDTSVRRAGRASS